MASYLGVDWADGCWLVVKVGDQPLIATEPSIFNVWHEHGAADDVKSILVDIPIGLLESGPRPCDEEAGEHLNSRRSSVFSVPGRDVVETTDYGSARSLNGGSLGSQSWWLFPRIREVDVFLQEYENGLEKVYESHPEICFHGFLDRQTYNKNTEEGRKERVEALKDYPPLYQRVCALVAERSNGAEWHNRISKSRLDDVL